MFAVCLHEASLGQESICSPCSPLKQILTADDYLSGSRPLDDDYSELTKTQLKILHLERFTPSMITAFSGPLYLEAAS